MQLYDFEIEFKENSYYGNIAKNDEYYLINGDNRVIISSPHCYRHYRNGAIKPHEYMTGALGKYVQFNTNCHLIYSAKYLDKDPNWDNQSSYRDDLNKYIIDNKIKFLIDLHGTKNKKYDLIIGTNSLNNINNSHNYFQIVKNFWKEYGYNVGYDVVFNASKENNICRNANVNTKVYALQFEISDDIRIDKFKSEKLARDLSDFVSLIDRLLIFDNIVISKKNESWWPLDCAVISKQFSKKYNIIDNDLISLKGLNYETGSELSVIVDDNVDDDIMFVSAKTMKTLEKKLNLNDLLFRKIESIPIKYIYKIDSNDICDDMVLVNAEMYQILKEQNFKYIKLQNTILNINATFKYASYTNDKKRGNSIWISQKNRSLLGIEMKNKYPIYEYDRIIKILSDDKFMDGHKDKKYLLTFFEECFSTEDSKNYTLIENIVSTLNNKFSSSELIEYSLDNKDKYQLLYKIRNDFKKLFLITLVGSSVNTFAPNNIIFDSLVGLSRGKLLTRRINDYLEGTKNVKINILTASIFDVQNNERLVIYYNKKRISCRVIVDNDINDMEIAIPKNVRSILNINHEKTVVTVKRDNGHIVFKKFDSMILTICLTILTILSFFKDFDLGFKWIIIVVILGIGFLIISSTFTERRKNVK